MKSEVIIDMTEACQVLGAHVKLRPENKAKVMASVEILLLKDEARPFQFRVVLFDTEAAATEYLNGQDIKTFVQPMNG